METRLSCLGSENVPALWAWAPEGKRTQPALLRREKSALGAC